MKSIGRETNLRIMLLFAISLALIVKGCVAINQM